jgi:hypothetical protein
MTYPQQVVFGQDPALNRCVVALDHADYSGRFDNNCVIDANSQSVTIRDVFSGLDNNQYYRG